MGTALVIGGFTTFVVCGMYVMEQKEIRIKERLVIILTGVSIIACYIGIAT